MRIAGQKYLNCYFFLDIRKFSFMCCLLTLICAWVDAGAPLEASRELHEKYGVTDLNGTSTALSLYGPV